MATAAFGDPIGSNQFVPIIRGVPIIFTCIFICTYYFIYTYYICYIFVYLFIYFIFIYTYYTYYIFVLLLFVPIIITDDVICDTKSNGLYYHYSLEWLCMYEYYVLTKTFLFLPGYSGKSNFRKI